MSSVGKVATNGSLNYYSTSFHVSCDAGCCVSRVNRSIILYTSSPSAYTGVKVFSERTRSVVAQKIQTLFIDDLDGSAAEGTVRFGLDGAEYEIDLNADHAKELRDALARYVSAARRTGGTAKRPAVPGRRRGWANGVNTTEVREWAKSQGIEVKDRGRIPAELVVKFKAASQD